MARSLNKVELIGNMTRDPELRYTPAGTAVCTFGLATNRQWTTDSGDKKEDVEFHRIVAWNKLAELCSQLLTKGRKVYVEGRLQTRKWTGQDQVERQTTEIVISDMIILDSRFSGGGKEDDFDVPEDFDEAVPTTDAAAQESAQVQAKGTTASDTKPAPAKSKPVSKSSMTKKADDTDSEEVGDDDIPF
jgi:single-strand DNA-binding protein